MVPSHLLGSLAADAEAAIRDALRNGVRGQPKPSDEPSYVASVVLGAVPDIAARWTRHLNPQGIGIDITGLLCHGTPKVDFASTGRAWTQGNTVCRELGDLLVVHDDLTPGRAARVAVLVQAKKSASGNVRKPDPHQLHLYVSWPIFESSFTTFPSGKRDFTNATTPGQINDCGLYGIIQTRLPGGPDWFVVPPAAPPLRAQSGWTLGRHMALMLDATANGHGRRAIPGGGDCWSKTVDDLLRTTGVRSFTHTFGPLLGPGLGRRDSISGYRGMVAAAFLAGVPRFPGPDFETITVGGSNASPPDDIPHGDPGFGIIHVRTRLFDEPPG